MAGKPDRVDLSSLQDKIASKMAAQKSSKAVAKTHSKTPAADSKESLKIEIIQREALELGASQEDVELIADIADNVDEQSEQEFSGTEDSEADEGLKGDLKDFMQKMGFDHHRTAAVINDDDGAGHEVLSSDEKEMDRQLSSDSIEQSSGSFSKVDKDDRTEAEGKTKSKESPKASSAKEAKALTPHNSSKSDTVNNGHPIQGSTIDSNKLLIPCDVPWYKVPLDAQLSETEDIEPLTQEQIDKLYARAKLALEGDNKAFNDEFSKDSSQRKFMSQMLTSGTLNDKISALTLLIQESPLHNMKSLDSLLSFCSKKSRNSALQSINALRDLFLNGILPNRKLRYFKNQPRLSMMLNKRTLAVFYFEDYLKRFFFQVLEILEKLSHDPIIHVRLQTLNHIFELLIQQPEQEVNLLRLGVNKLGDIDTKVASKTSYLLLQLQQQHPNMKSVVIDAIVDLALKPNADYHTTYYSVITLNQTILKRSEDSIANKLIKTYFTLFEKFLITSDKSNIKDSGIKSNHKGYEAKRKKNVKKGKNGGKSVKLDKSDEEILGEKNSKLFSAILTGMNRAFPFAQLPSSIYESHLDTLFRITHSANFNTSVQALSLIHQVTMKANLNPDRYYRTLYESLLDPRLLNSSKQGVYLNILYKALKHDAGNLARVQAFVKRIMQISMHWLNVGSITGFLYLLLQLTQNIPGIRNLLTNTPIDDEYASGDEEADVEEKQGKKFYDSRKRDPKFANADKSSLWELGLFLAHYHPAVETYINAFVENSVTDVTKPDLGLYTLSHFLDRFVYRNAKQKPVQRGQSIMQPLFGGSQLNNSVIVKATDVAKGSKPANMENWLAKKVEDVSPEDRFFHQYFTTKTTKLRSTEGAGTKRSSDFDEEEGSEDLDEDEIWKALVRSKPDVEADDEDDDIGFGSDDFSMSSDSEIDVEAQETDDSDVGSSDDDQFYSFDNGGLADAEDQQVDDGSEEDDNLLLNTLQEDEQSDNTSDKDTEQPRKKQKKSKGLPVFASAEDYAQYLDDDDEN